ncbi:MAG: hypothetical protein AAF806_03065 [Bacteroidota bacterium]
MEDIEIAKGMIGRIIGEEIVELYFRPQELKTKSERYLVVILRIDFKAIIRTKEGEYKKVLIEIQKGKEDNDILRFRNYLAENYKGKDNIRTEEKEEEQTLPIVSIYFLGFPLQRIDSLAVKVGRTYTDIINDEEIKEKDEFIERLTHDGYFIQLRKLDQIEDVDNHSKKALLKILNIFNQSYRLTYDRRLLEISESEIGEDPLLKKMINRLKKAAVDTEILRKIEVEEQVENRIEKQIRRVAVLEEQIEEKEKAIEEKEKAIEEKEKAIEEQDRILEEKEEALEKLKREKIEAAKKLMENTDLTDEQIASFQKMELGIIKKIRKNY